MPLSTPEAKEALNAAIDEATSALASKNKELLAELKDARKGRAIDPAELEKLELQVDGLKAELSASQKLAKESVKSLEMTQKQLNEVTEKGNKATIDTELTSSLIAAGVKDDHYLTAVKALFSGQAKIGEDGKPVIGDKPLSESISEWAKTDAAKHFQSAPDNSGGGSNGNKGGGNTPDLSKLKPTDRINAARAGAK